MVQKAFLGQLSRVGVIALSIVLLSISSSQAGVIKFEKTPGGSTPLDNAVLANPYTVDGVTIDFSVDTTNTGGGSVSPVFEQIGVQMGETISGTNSGGGFTKSTGVTAAGDEAAAGFESRLGNWFLRYSDGRTRHTFVIDYTSVSSTVVGASGEIWDIDKRAPTSGMPGAEQWLVEAFDGTGASLATQMSPLGLEIGDTNTLDARPWRFKFDGLTGGDGNGIRQIRISYVGDDTVGDTVGLAFNNFSPVVAVPEPASALLLSLGTVLLSSRRRRA